MPEAAISPSTSLFELDDRLVIDAICLCTLRSEHMFLLQFHTYLDIATRTFVVSFGIFRHLGPLLSRWEVVDLH